ncbi:MAG: pitrilysin family protein, partial [Planctomycetota bacterium]
RSGCTGLAHFAGSLADQGTEGRSDEDIARLLEPEGGAVRGDSLGLFGTVAGDGWPTLLEVLGDLVQRASYPDDRIARQLARVRTRLEVEADDPRAQGGILFKRLVYGDESHLGRSSYGDLESIDRITPEALRAHRAEHWTGRRLIVTFVGDVDVDEVRARAEEVFGGLAEGTAHEFVAPPVPARGARTSSFVRDRNQTHVHLGHVGIVRSHPDYAALAVMDHVLGTGPGFTNRITRVLRDELGLAYTVHADIHHSAGRNPGVFRAYIGTSPEHVTTAIDGFKREMRRIQDEPVPAEELDVAKSYLVGSFAMGFERAVQRASYLVSAEVHGFPDDQLTQLPAEFAAVTAEDVQRVAREHLFPDECCIVTAGSEPAR